MTYMATEWLRWPKNVINNIDEGISAVVKVVVIEIFFGLINYFTEISVSLTN